MTLLSVTHIVLLCFYLYLFCFGVFNGINLRACLVLFHGLHLSLLLYLTLLYVQHFGIPLVVKCAISIKFVVAVVINVELTFIIFCANRSQMNFPQWITRRLILNWSTFAFVTFDLINWRCQKFWMCLIFKVSFSADTYV